jgi:hypothetical protein
MFLNHLRRRGKTETTMSTCSRRATPDGIDEIIVADDCPIYRCLGQRVGLASREGSQLDGYAIAGLVRAHQTGANSSYRHRFSDE